MDYFPVTTTAARERTRNGTQRHQSRPSSFARSDCR